MDMLCAGSKIAYFRIERSVSSTRSHRIDLEYWTLQMGAVAGARDRDSFMRLYDHFMPRLVMYLRGLGSEEMVAEELAQEAMLRLWQRAAAFDAERGHVSTWLFRIARNLRLDRQRKEPWWLPVQDGWDALDAELDGHVGAKQRESPEAFAEGKELQRRLDRLPAIQARLLRMSYLESKTHQEIAIELDMPLGTVKSTLRRAFLKLQTTMTHQP